MKIIVVGAGYVGLVTGVVFADIGHDITFIDKDENKIESLQNGVTPIYEPGLTSLIAKNQDRLNYVKYSNSAYNDAEIIFIAVGTPENSVGKPDLTQIYQVCDEMLASVTKDCMIVVKSTVPVGTCDDIELYMLKNNKNNTSFTIVSNPEFLSQGNAVNEARYPSRIVIGSTDEKAIAKMKKIYSLLIEEPQNTPFLVMSKRSAEMVKYASNSFLALKISYINEIANICEKVDSNIEDVTLGMGFDKRIGNEFLRAGIGYGGSCLPKDTKSLYETSKDNNCESTVLKSCIDINSKRRELLFERVIEKFKDLSNLKVAILGLTFKPDTDDIRFSSAIDNVDFLLKKNANVNLYDPVGNLNFKRHIDINYSDSDAEKINYFSSIDEAILDCDLVIIITEWSEIKDYDINKYVILMKTPYIFDGRNCYDVELMKKHKVYYNSIGRVTINNIKK